MSNGTSGNKVSQQESGEGLVSPHIENWSQHDVPLGRSQVVRDHIGNKRFRKLVEKNRQAYLNAKRRADKTVISTNIYATINANGGRFLHKNVQENGENWFEISEEKALAKITQALRMGTGRIRESPTQGSPLQAESIDEIPAQLRSFQPRASPLVASRATMRQEYGGAAISAGPALFPLGVSTRPPRHSLLGPQRPASARDLDDLLRNEPYRQGGSQYNPWVGPFPQNSNVEPPVGHSAMPMASFAFGAVSQQERPQQQRDEGSQKARSRSIYHHTTLDELPGPTPSVGPCAPLDPQDKFLRSHSDPTLSVGSARLLGIHSSVAEPPTLPYDADLASLSLQWNLEKESRLFSAPDAPISANEDRTSQMMFEQEASESHGENLSSDVRWERASSPFQDDNFLDLEPLPLLEDANRTEEGEDQSYQPAKRRRNA